MIKLNKKTHKIPIPVHNKGPIIDECFILLKLPKNIEIEIPATFKCYHILEKAFNTAYNFKEVSNKKPLIWFVSEYEKNNFAINSEILLSVLNELLEKFVECDYKLQLNDFNDAMQLKIISHLIFILCQYCIGGSGEGKKLEKSLLTTMAIQIKKKKQNQKKTKTYTN